MTERHLKAISHLVKQQISITLVILLIVAAQSMVGNMVSTASE